MLLLNCFLLSVDGSWGEWGEWSKCTKSCKFGTQSRSRKCSNPAQAHGGKDCEGPAEQSRKCNEKVPVQVKHGNFFFPFLFYTREICLVSLGTTKDLPNHCTRVFKQSLLEHSSPHLLTCYKNVELQLQHLLKKD